MAQYLYVIDTGITTTSLDGTYYPGGISVGQTTYDFLVQEKYKHGVIPIENTLGFWRETTDNIGIYVTNRLVGIGTSVGLDYQLNVTGNGTSTSQMYVSGVSTFVGVTTNSSTIFAKQLNVSGVSTFVGFTTFRQNVFVAGITTSLSYATSGTTTSTDATTATFTIDASTTQLYHHSASFNGNKTFQISNLTNGKSVYLYLRNTDSLNNRTMSIQASTTTSGYTSVELSRSGSLSVSSFGLSASTGTAVVWVVNIGGNLVGSLY